MFESEMTPTERAGLAVWLLSQTPMTPRVLAERLEITPHGARAMLRRLSLAVPLVDDNGEWRICGSDGTFEEGRQ
jgi:hypothetical protein